MEDANARIEEIRQSQVEFNFLNVEATELRLEVEQLSHTFPFGQAVSSERLSECQYSGVDHDECLFIRENYNWIVDTWRSARPRATTDQSSFLLSRMKWDAIEPHQGDFKVDIPDLMIAWAQGNNITVRGRTGKCRITYILQYYIYALVLLCTPGHSLLWHKSQPRWTSDLFGTEFTSAMFQHLDDTLEHFDSLGVNTWDVINGRFGL